MNSSSKKINSYELLYTGSKKHLNTRKRSNTTGSDANIKMNETSICTAYVGRFFIMFPRTVLLYNNSIILGNRSFDLTFATFYDRRGEIIVRGIRFRFVPLVVYHQVKSYVNRVHICEVTRGSKKLIMYSATL